MCVAPWCLFTVANEGAGHCSLFAQLPTGAASLVPRLPPSFTLRPRGVTPQSEATEREGPLAWGAFLQGHERGSGSCAPSGMLFIFWRTQAAGRAWPSAHSPRLDGRDIVRVRLTLQRAQGQGLLSLPPGFSLCAPLVLPGPEVRV